MARPTLFAHGKFAHLVHLLRDTVAPRALALGALELIWEAGYASGDPFLGPSDAVEALANWRGDAGKLAEALRVSRLLDVDAAGQYVIHDLMDHAPKYVQRRMMREAERKREGITISEIRARAARARHGVAAKTVAEPVPPEAPPPPTALDPVVLTFDCVGNGPEKFQVTRSFMQAQAIVYPGVDVEIEFRKALNWLHADPKRRKTHKGMPRFLVGWLNRAQDRGSPSFGNRPSVADQNRATFERYHEAKGTR